MTAVPPDPAGLAALKSALDLPKQVLDLGCGLVRDLVGEPVKVVGAMLGDQVYWWQWRNRVRIANRAAEIMEKDGIARRIVPPSFLLPLLEAAGNVEDRDLSEMWARLLASGVAADEHQHPLWVKILAQMSAEDARALQQVCARTDARGIPFVSDRDRFYGDIDAESDADARLFALGLTTPMTSGRLEGGEITSALSRLGAQFRRAVMRPARSGDQSAK